MKGATSIFKDIDYLNDNFNPRTHEGCDDNIDRETFLYHLISIHAPMKGATLVN